MGQPTFKIVRPCERPPTPPQVRAISSSSHSYLTQQQPSSKPVKIYPVYQPIKMANRQQTSVRDCLQPAPVSATYTPIGESHGINAIPARRRIMQSYASGSSQRIKDPSDKLFAEKYRFYSDSSPRSRAPRSRPSDYYGTGVKDALQTSTNTKNIPQRPSTSYRNKSDNMMQLLSLNTDTPNTPNTQPIRLSAMHQKIRGSTQVSSLLSDQINSNESSNELPVQHKTINTRRASQIQHALGSDHVGHLLDWSQSNDATNNMKQPIDITPAEAKLYQSNEASPIAGKRIWPKEHSKRELHYNRQLHGEAGSHLARDDKSYFHTESKTAFSGKMHGGPKPAEPKKQGRKFVTRGLNNPWRQTKIY